MTFGIVTFPGSNCDYDAYHAVVDQLGEEAVYLWHKDHDLQRSDVIVLPGGFSYGDYLRAGAIARFSPIMQEVVAFAKRGGPVIAICNGFQIACEAGLLPGALLRNASLKFVSELVSVRVETTDTLFSNRYETGQVLRIPIAHGDGRYTADEETVDRLEGEGRVVFRYVDANPNGSRRDIAGISNARGNVVGLMPHPEHAVEVGFGPDAVAGPRSGTDGLRFFTSVLASLVSA